MRTSIGHGTATQSPNITVLIWSLIRDNGNKVWHKCLKLGKTSTALGELAWNSCSERQSPTVQNQEEEVSNKGTVATGGQQVEVGSPNMWEDDDGQISIRLRIGSSITTTKNTTMRSKGSNWGQGRRQSRLGTQWWRTLRWDTHRLQTWRWRIGPQGQLNLRHVDDEQQEGEDEHDHNKNKRTNMITVRTNNRRPHQTKGQSWSRRQSWPGFIVGGNHK